MAHRVRIEPVQLVLALVLAAAGCDGSDIGAPGIGSLLVWTTTTGENPDLDGYVVQVDGVDSQTVSAAGVRIFSDLAAGAHLVEFSGVAENCWVNSGNTRTVTVISSDTVAVKFAVECAATLSGQASVTISAASPWDYGPEFGFGPESVAVTNPGTVTWTNTTGVEHNVTFAPATGAPPNIPRYSSGSVTRNFTAAGTYQYRCTIHDGMRGRVVVVEATNPWNYQRAWSRSGH